MEREKNKSGVGFSVLSAFHNVSQNNSIWDFSFSSYSKNVNGYDNGESFTLPSPYNKKLHIYTAFFPFFYYCCIDCIHKSKTKPYAAMHYYTSAL